ncbi:hypothetical protein QBC40DRAFT_226105 [Triangularia verruculosa]|uniref:Uncharacterized protein n=1 Tax=Triangularia verruculosa TaxID=2587418 RepID=A0AAN6XG99_9PEZI|nr:hypothetical protein QBC40DRAFT_226105 [Triangularia verruculosa]
MGLLEDASSVISARTGHSTSKRGHRSGRKHRSRSKDRGSPRHYEQHRDRDHDRDRSRSRRRSSKKHHDDGGSVIGGITSFFTASPSSDDDNDDLVYGDHDPQPTSRSRRHRSRSRSRHRDDESFFSQSNASRALFNLGGGNASRSSFFANFGGRSSPAPSYYRRSPRKNFVQKLYKKVKRLIRDLINHAKRHPLKVFMLVIMPLVTGGFLTALLAKVGIRLPKFIERMIGVAGKAASGDSAGLVGEAVRLAGGVGGAAGAVKMAKSTMERSSRGYDGSSWEKRTEHFTKEFGGGSGGGWGDGVVKGVTKFFSD